MATTKTFDIKSLEGLEQTNSIYAISVDKQNDLTASVQSNIETYEAGTLTYKLSSDGSYYIVSGIGTYEGTVVTILPQYNGKDVKEIGDYAFRSNGIITGISLTENITKIGEGAFAGAGALASITIPKSVTEISKNAFESCTALATVNFSEGSMLKEIGGSAFWRCSQLASINLPDNLQHIGSSAFRDCPLLYNEEDTFVVPSGVETIGDMAFMRSGIRRIDFSRATLLTEIPTQMCRDSKLVSVKLGNNITKIGSSAFRAQLENIPFKSTNQIPSTVKYIGAYAFGEDATYKQDSFENPYGWFRVEGEEIPKEIINGETCNRAIWGSTYLSDPSLNNLTLFKLDKIPAPVIKIEGDTLTITDYSDLAEEFHIYVNGNLSQIV